MGYHVSIIRTPSPITSKEVGLAMSNLSKYEFTEGKITRHGSFFLQFTNGELWISNPGEQDIDDMLEIANVLNARVRGDEYETYLGGKETYTHDDDVDFIKHADSASKKMLMATRRRGIIMHCCIFGFFLLLAVIVSYLER